MPQSRPLIFTLALSAATALAQTGSLDMARIEQITGLKGVAVPDEHVFKVTAPRTDVHATVDGIAVPPFAGLTSWAAFQPAEGSDAMVMGDLVLFQDEVNPVMDALFDAGLSVTGLHNHFFYDNPRIFFMHIGGDGPVEQLATGVRKAFDAVKFVREHAPQPDSGFGAHKIAQPSAITAGPVEGIIGGKGESKEGIVKVVVGRSTREHGSSVGNAMGVNTWAAFVGTDEEALVDGDFACLPGELQPTLRALREAGINIVAIHNHMESELPRVIFLHYWGYGQATDLAHGVRAALDAQARVGEHASGLENTMP